MDEKCETLSMNDVTQVVQYVFLKLQLKLLFLCDREGRGFRSNFHDFIYANPFLYFLSRVVCI